MKKPRTNYQLDTNKLLTAIRKLGRRTPFRAQDVYLSVAAKTFPEQGIVRRRLEKLAESNVLERLPGARRKPFYCLATTQPPKSTLTTNGATSLGAADRLSRIEAAISTLDAKVEQLIAMWS